MNTQVTSQAPVAAAAPQTGKKAASPKQVKTRRVCNVCGKPSGSNICATCSDRIRAEALARKKREDKGEE